MLSDRELTFYDVISFLGDDASHYYNNGALTLFKNTAFGRTYWRAGHVKENHPVISEKSNTHWSFDERMSSEVLFNYDDVRLLYTFGRLFSDLCSTPSDFNYQWKQGVLTRTRTARDGRPIKNQTTEEAIAVHFSMSTQMAEVRAEKRESVDTSRPFTISLYPSTFFAAAKEPQQY